MDRFDQSALSRFRNSVELPLAACRRAFWAVALFSGAINLLMLAGAIYMLQVYDRVLTSRSIPTLLGLTLLLASVFLIQGALDLLRQKILTRIGIFFDRELSPAVFQITCLGSAATGVGSDTQQPMRDLDTTRSFLSGLGLAAFFDLPWIPVFLILCFVLHFWIGVVVLLACGVLVGVTLLAERATKQPLKVATGIGSERAQLVEESRRQAEAITAMGMNDALLLRFNQYNDRFLEATERATNVSARFTVVSKLFRMAMQSGILGVSAWLVLSDQATAGVMIASSILMGRALAPIDTVVSHWKSFIAARQAWGRLVSAIDRLPVSAEPLSLPAPRHSLVVDEIYASAPGSPEPLIFGVSFSIAPGQALGIIGASASGKSTLARVLSGAWPPLRGSVRLDGAELGQWSGQARGRFIGYLPQDMGLFHGTVAENIARFKPDATAESIVEAARSAGVDDIIRRLPEGYNTRIGMGGLTLSGGQRQLIALARALYGNPFVVILDEPNSNLDAEGEEAVKQAIRSVRARKGIVIIVAHRPSALAAVNLVAVMSEGRLQAFGPRDEVLKPFVQRPSARAS